jgi:hypothetical protein
MYRRAFFCLLVLAAGCTGARDDRSRFEPATPAQCVALDSAFTLSGWRSPMDLTGKVKLDVKQYRVQGRFRAHFAGNGDFTFEFAGTMVMGGHHEDVVVSFNDGRLYVLDRERGRFYEGEETNRLTREGLGTDWDMVFLVRAITAIPPACDRLSRIEVRWIGDGSAELDGRVDGESFSARFEGGRIERASWPLISAAGKDDRLSVRYRWRAGEGRARTLEELEGFVEGRRWRIILDVD